MKLLICTQALDSQDPVLGFFVRWVEELAKKYEQVEVICLRAGSQSTPQNVRVHTLPPGRLARVNTLLRLSRTLQYDAVFVHMGQEFVLAAGWYWRMLGKPVYLWRNHYAGSFLTSLAAQFAKKVFYTSKFSYTARYSHARRMPVGVEVTSTGAARIPQSILFLGRVTPSKRPEMLLAALKDLPHLPATICGPGDAAYVEALVRQVEQERLQVVFQPGVPHQKIGELLQRHELLVNCSLSGMLDKTIFEAALCSCVPLASSKDWQERAPELYFADADALSERLRWYIALPEHEKITLRARVRALCEPERLAHLVDRLVAEMAISA